MPTSLHGLIFFAELYGISDDGYRDQVLEHLTDVERDELVVSVEAHDDALDTWLAGPESNQSNQTPEYIAFSAMRMAADAV